MKCEFCKKKKQTLIDIGLDTLVCAECEAIYDKMSKDPEIRALANAQARKLSQLVDEEFLKLLNN